MVREYDRQRSLKALLRVGVKIGKLTLKQLDREERGYCKSGNSWREVFWLCQCDCGNQKIIRQSSLKAKNGGTQSCGCLQKQHLGNVTKALKDKRLDFFIGRTFNYLTIVSFYKIENYKTIVICKCRCGNTKNIQLTLITNGRVKSCGCLIHEPSPKRLPEGMAAFNYLYSTYNNSAKKRNLAFELAEYDAAILFKGCCYYCGDPPQQTAKSLISDYIYNGIDRKNNKLGYILTNCVSCCGKCNFAKHNMTVQEFKEWAFKLYKNLRIINHE